MDAWVAHLSTQPFVFFPPCSHLIRLPGQPLNHLDNRRLVSNLGESLSGLIEELILSVVVAITKDASFGTLEITGSRDSQLSGAAIFEVLSS